ncbi:hypothetical protein SAMN05421545_0364 [Pontibacter lucknowensis]|uniref:Uncharacterized protein n=1 Tax=Pontibacter lucknowensis TaxID=1077936 RepID=A0A1N6TJC1_9BACT|nr:hypothetical protein SAMN05421545_0364 [Pontibacter lucknowensis]
MKIFFYSLLILLVYIIAYFIWQIIGGILQTIFLGGGAWVTFSLLFFLIHLAFTIYSYKRGIIKSIYVLGSVILTSIFLQMFVLKDVF